MADIKLNDLQPAGSEFFADNEGYLNDLSEDELSIWGGHSHGGGHGGGDDNISVLNSDISDVNVSVGNLSLGNVSGQF